MAILQSMAAALVAGESYGPVMDREQRRIPQRRAVGARVEVSDLITMDVRERMTAVDRAALRERVELLCSGERTVVALRRAGVALVALGEYERAQALLTEALEAVDSSGTVRDQVSVRINLGDAYRYAGLFEPAMPLYRHAVALARDACPAVLDYALQHLGKGLHEQGNRTEAVDALRAALDIRRKKGDPELIESTRRALRLVLAESPYGNPAALG